MITLQKLVLENFMNVASAEFDFNGKIIIISGASGTGKSAVFDAIALCLSSKKRSALYSDYVKQNASHAKVILDCIINNEPVNFNLQINLIRGTPFQMALTYKGKIYQNTEAAEILKSFDIEYYADIIFSMQSDDFKDITQLSPTQRANYLQRLLNFDFINEKDQLKKDIDEYTTQLVKINNDIAINEQLKLKENESKENKISIVYSDEQIQEYQNKIKNLQELIVKTQKDQSDISELNKLLNENSEEIQSLTREENKLEGQLTSLMMLSENTKKWEDEIENIENTIIEQNKEIKKIDITINEGLERIKALDKLIFEGEKLERKNSLTRLDLLNIKKLHDEKKCPHCGQPTENFAEVELKKILKEINEDNNIQEIDDYIHSKDNSNNFHKIISFITHFEKNMLREGAKLQDTVLIKKDAEEQVSFIKGQRLVKEIALQDLQKNKKDLQNKIDNNQYDSIELVTVRDDLAAVKVKLANKELDQKKIKYDLTKYSDALDISVLSNEMIQLTNIINQNSADIKKNEEIEIRNQQRLLNIKNYEAVVEKLQKEIGIITSKLNIHNEAYNILDKTLPNYMVVSTCGKLQKEMNTFIQSIFPTYEVRLSNSKKGCEFFYTKDKTVQEGLRKKNNAWINARMSSGFEKSTLTLAFKISLATLYGLDILVLDECDGAADAESAEKLYDGLLSKSFDQLFLISHKTEIRDFITDNFDNVLCYTAFNGTFKSDVM
jgi:DNA repair exonuclease SbcCD ATPase subunit